MSSNKNNIAAFRGLAGEVIYHFISLSTVISAIPVLIFFVIFGFVIFTFIPESLFPLHILLMYLLSAIAVSRFALPAARGVLTGGWFNKHIEKGETLGFVIRYAILTLIWGIPCAILIYIAGQMGGNAMMMGPMSLTSMGFSGLIMILVGVIMIFAPTMSFIICTATSETSDVLGIQPWRELLSEEFPSLVVFYASMFGGVISFLLIYAIPLAIIISLLSLASPELAGTLSVFIVSLPATMAPILIGRLAGAMVLGSQYDFADNEIVETNSNYQNIPHTSSTIAQANTKSPPAPSNDNKSTTPLSVINNDSITSVTPQPGEAKVTPNPISQPVSMDSPSPISSEPLSVTDSGLLSTTSLQHQAQSIEEKLLKKIENIQSYQLSNAITISQSRLNNRPNDPLITAEIAIMKGRANQAEGLGEIASKAIHLNLSDSNQLLVINILQSIGNSIQNLGLNEDEYQRCSELLSEKNLYYLAAVCIVKGKSFFTQEIDAENKILSLAMTANKQKLQKQTIAILGLFKQQFPRSKHIPKVTALLQQAGKSA